MTDIYIGLDLGTSGLKGVAVDADGDTLARASAAYPTRRPEPGAAEQDPADWIAAAADALSQLRGATDSRRWRGIGLSGMIPTLVTVTADGSPAGPAITWQDSRADALGEKLRERIGGDALYRRTGQWVDGRYLLPMFLRVAAAEPARAAGTTLLASAKDYLFGWLTGVIATDPSTASGYGCYRLADGAWDGEVLAAAASVAGDAGAAVSARQAADPDAGVSARQAGHPVPAAGGLRLPSLPPVLPSATCHPLRGEVAARLGCGQLPVCLGAADSVLGAVGLGVREPGQVAYVAGTSTVILGVSDTLLFDPRHRFLVTPLAEPDRWGLEMDLLATGSAIRWLAGLLGDDLDEAGLVALAATTDPADAPVVLPYLGPGEQGALWDPLLRGAISGLELRHGRRHLARGLVNGIILESRRCLAVLDETGPFDREIRVAGGSAASNAFRKDLGDATRRRVSMPDGTGADCSARGAAMIAAHAVDGGWLPVPDAHAADSPESRPASEPAAGLAARPTPSPDRAELWDRLWDRHERARLATSR